MMFLESLVCVQILISSSTHASDWKKAAENMTIATLASGITPNLRRRNKHQLAKHIRVWQSVA
jgi:hypothetical protein